MLPAGVEMAMDPAAHDFIFKFGRRPAGLQLRDRGRGRERVGSSPGTTVTNNLREYSARELDAALGRGRVAVADLERLRRC